MTLREAIAMRRAVRAYKPDFVPEEAIRALLEAAVRAPTAMHAEPWAFAVVQDRALLEKWSKLAKASWLQPRDGAASAGATSPATSAALALMTSPDFNIFYDAGTLVLICARPMGGFVMADCWLAAENLMLEACSMGLGTCPVGFAVPILNRADVKADLGIPQEAAIVAPIVVGVPRGEPQQTSRKAPEVLAWLRAPSDHPEDDVTRPAEWPE